MPSKAAKQCNSAAVSDSVPSEASVSKEGGNPGIAIDVEAASSSSSGSSLPSVFPSPKGCITD